MRVRAALDSAIGAVATRRHAGMSEWTGWIRTIWEEFAVGLARGGCSDGGRRVLSDTLAILTSGAVGTDVGEVDRSVWRCRGRLVGIYAGGICAVEVEVADCRRRVFGLRGLDFHRGSGVSWDTRCCCFDVGVVVILTLVVVSAILTVITAVDSLKQRLALI